MLQDALAKRYAWIDKIIHCRMWAKEY